MGVGGETVHSTQMADVLTKDRRIVIAGSQISKGRVACHFNLHNIPLALGTAIVRGRPNRMQWKACRRGYIPGHAMRESKPSQRCKQVVL